MTTPQTSRLPGAVTPAGETTTSPLPDGPIRPVAGATGRTWTIALPAGMELLTSNDLGNWGNRHRIGKPIRDAVIVLVRVAKIPHLERVSIVAIWHAPPGRRKVVRDCHNLSPSLKVAVDGIKKAGVVTDDSDRYVANTDIRPGEKHPLGQLVIHITEITNEDPS